MQHFAVRIKMHLTPIFFFSQKRIYLLFEILERYTAQFTGDDRSMVQQRRKGWLIFVEPKQAN